MRYFAAVCLGGCFLLWGFVPVLSLYTQSGLELVHLTDAGFQVGTLHLALNDVFS